MTGNPPRQVTPRQLDFDMLASWLRRTYPSADIQITQTTMAPLATPPDSCDDVNALLSQFVAMLPAQDQRTRYYGLIPDNGKQNFVGGCSAIPSGPNQGGHFGSGPAGPLFPEQNPWDTDGSYADAYGGHEIAHMYGRLHPGYCADQDRGDPAYPYSAGRIGASVYDFQGLDAGDAGLGLPLALYDWRSGWSDVMTYCHFQWMSDYTFRGILQMSCAEDVANCPEHALFGARAPGREAAPRRSQAGAVSITGTLSLATGEVTLAPLWVRPGLTPTPAVSGSEYAIELRGAGDHVLARYGVAPQQRSDAASAADAKALLHAVVPFHRATRRIAITHGAQTLASVRVSARAPRVRILSPGGGKTLRGQVTVRWRAKDPDGNRLVYSVLYTPDGRRFLSLATGLTRTALRVDLSRLPGGTRARFEVVASDGVRTSSDRSRRPFSVAGAPPRVSIASPAPNAELVAGRPIVLTGAAADPLAGSLSGSQLVWSSSLQGALGRGTAITTELRPGKHVLTLRATTGTGRSASASVTVNVRAVPPVVPASIEAGRLG
jgi:hypothetical protein